MTYLLMLLLNLGLTFNDLWCQKVTASLEVGCQSRKASRAENVNII